MSTIVVKYPLDLTGKSPQNHVVGERHTLSPGINRAVVPRYGAFYTDTLRVVDAANGEELKPNDQYVPIMYYEEPSERSGKEVCAGIVITDREVSDEVIIDLNYVGGFYSNITPVIIDLISELNLDNREVRWGDLLGKPDAFPPASHLHDLGDIYGFEYVVEALEKVRQAILYGDVASHDEIKEMLQARFLEFMARAQEIEDQLNRHEADKGNPHETTKAQVGLGLVENYRPATAAEAIEGAASNLYVVASTLMAAIQHHAIDPLNAHKADYDNPHRTTKAQVGLGLVDNYPTASNAEAIAGTAPDRFIVASTLKAALQHHAIDPLNAHAANKNNPHSVTKAQVGLGLVDNFATANNTQAITGTAANLFVTPASALAAIQHHAINPLNSHIGNRSNPHGVTKAQVGLGNVDNFATANNAQAIAATATNLFMTPATVKAAIDNHAIPPLNAHKNDKSNPHAVTKAQVGLGNLPNAIGRQRTTNSDGILMTVGGMFDHINAGDHDHRYVLRNGDTVAGLQTFQPAAGTQHIVPAGQTGGGGRFITKFISSGADDGGIYVKTGDDNGDELAFEAVNFNNQSVFRVNATNGSIWTAGTITGNGSGITTLNASNLASGLVPIARLPISSSRQYNVTTHVLTAKGMYDHNQSGDHDHRYVRKDAHVNGSIHVTGGRAYVYVDGAWRQFWPAQWA